MELSNENKNKIVRLLDPYVKSIDDIFGFEDINYLLDLYPEVQRRNFKLWLSSISLLDILVHSKIRNRTNAFFATLLNDAKRYVETDYLAKAKEVISQNNFCLISGPPGTGKTTLAKMLLLQYSKQNFEIIYVSKDIDEAFEMLQEGKPQIFYFDDFLGSTRLTPNSLNHDQRLIDFISLIQRGKNSYLILTTREYILNQAISYFDDFSFHVSTLMNAKFIVRMEDYTLYQKALIFYNHIYFSRINDGNVGKYVTFVKYREIIEHRNYSPRIIDWVMNSDSSITSENFITVLKDRLDNPTLLWKSMFENQISQSARNILTILFTFESAKLDEIKSIYERFEEYAHSIGHTTNTSNDFEYVMLEIEGTAAEIFENGSDVMVKFSNPSIIDFLGNHFYNNPILLIRVLKNLNELSHLWSLAVNAYTGLSKRRYFKNLNAFINPKVQSTLGDRLEYVLDETIESGNFSIVNLSNFEEMFRNAMTIVSNSKLYPAKLVSVSKKFIDQSIDINHPHITTFLNDYNNAIIIAKLSDHYQSLRLVATDHLKTLLSMCNSSKDVLVCRRIFEVLGEPSEFKQTIIDIHKTAILKFYESIDIDEYDEVDIDRINDLYTYIVDNNSEDSELIMAMGRISEAVYDKDNAEHVQDEYNDVESQEYNQITIIDYTLLMDTDDRFISDIIDLLTSS